MEGWNPVQTQNLEVSICIVAINNWEIYAQFWENLVHILIGKRPVFGPKYGLGKSLSLVTDNNPS